LRASRWIVAATVARDCERMTPMSLRRVVVQIERRSMRPWARVGGSLKSGWPRPWKIRRIASRGVGGDRLAGDVEGLQERDDHPDLVGLFEFVAAVYGQGADFFWLWQVWLWWPTTPRMWAWRASASMALHMVFTLDGQPLVGCGLLEVPAL
jgi:hypothetical protein